MRDGTCASTSRTAHPVDNVAQVAYTATAPDFAPAQFPTAPLSESAAAALERLERAFAPKAVA